jgi:putative ABC transport system permease protein
MLKNYFKIAWRNIRKERGFSAINIFGLAIGLATCLLITLFVMDELSYDKYNERADRIYRVDCDLHINGSALTGTFSPDPMGPALAKDFPQIQKTVRIDNSGNMAVRHGNETIIEPNTAFADSTFFEIFTEPMIAGDYHTALKEPYSMVISESMAKKYFPGSDALGKTLLVNNTTNYKITGVIRDMPAQSHFHLTMIKAISEQASSRGDNWLSNNVVTYLMIAPGATGKDIDHCLSAAIKKYMGPQLQMAIHASLDDLEKHGDYFHYTAVPLTRIHLYSNIKGEFEANGNIRYIYIFVVIAILILLVACINFMNLSTARSANRAKEIGVRKVLGSQRGSLIYQFLVESVLTSLLALVLAIGIVILLLPYFNRLSGKNIPLLRLYDKNTIPVMLLAATVVGLIAGSYPAFYLSGFRPIQVLKGKLSTGFRSGWLRNSLVVFQFTTAIVLIIGTLVIYSQLNYIRNKELGYDRQQIIILKNTYPIWNHCKDFRNNILQLAGVTAGTISGNLPNTPTENSSGYFKDPTAKASDAAIMGRWMIDADYIPTLGMQIVKGRNFSDLMPTDSSGVLINQEAARYLNFSDPINKNVYTLGGDRNDKVKAYHILGVVKDFNAGTLHDKIEPIVFHLGEERGAISFRVNTKDMPALLAKIKDKYAAVPGMAGQPFLYSFMDDDFNKLYASDQRTGSICITFAVLAIFIACLGLFGLVTYAAEQRTREIGIRKVLGAKLGNVIGLLSKDFLKLVTLSALIAFPLAWWAMHQWLQDFAYRTNIGWWVFVVAGLCALLITMLTVSFRAIRAGLANPMESLRSE